MTYGIVEISNWNNMMWKCSVQDEISETRNKSDTKRKLLRLSENIVVNRKTDETYERADVNYLR